MAPPVIGPTLRKVALLATIPFVLLLIANALSLGPEASMLVVAGFAAGMLFPDIDVLTGFIRTSFQTMVLIVLMLSGKGGRAAGPRPDLPHPRATGGGEISRIKF